MLISSDSLGLPTVMHPHTCLILRTSPCSQSKNIHLYEEASSNSPSKSAINPTCRPFSALLHYRSTTVLCSTCFTGNYCAKHKNVPKENVENASMLAGFHFKDNKGQHAQLCSFSVLPQFHSNPFVIVLVTAPKSQKIHILSPVHSLAPLDTRMLASGTAPSHILDI